MQGLAFRSKGTSSIPSFASFLSSNAIKLNNALTGVVFQAMAPAVSHSGVIQVRSKISLIHDAFWLQLWDYRFGTTINRLKNMKAQIHSQTSITFRFPSEDHKIEVSNYKLCRSYMVIWITFELSNSTTNIHGLSVRVIIKRFVFGTDHTSRAKTHRHGS